MVEPIAKVEALKDGRLIVWSKNEGQRLYRLGYFGKPLGIPKPKEDFDAPLVLDPIEGLYLLEKGLIKVFSGSELQELDINEFKKIVASLQEDFEEKYRVYKDLREKGFIVAPGIKYGCDFAVYRMGPGVDHAPFIVQVKKIGEEISASELVKAGRLATTVRKTFIIAVIHGKDINYLGFTWWKP